MSNPDTDDLLAEMYDIAAGNAFTPILDPDPDLDFEVLTPKARKTVEWMADRGFDCFRTERDGSMTFMSWSPDEGLRLTNTTESGVVNSEARFDLTRRGLIWISQAVA